MVAHFVNIYKSRLYRFYGNEVYLIVKKKKKEKKVGKEVSRWWNRAGHFPGCSVA